MITVSCCGATVECTTAIKGDTFVHLLDENDHIIAAFEGVTDFSLFTISGGSWTAAEDLSDCYIVVMRRDGTLDKSSKKFGDL